MKLISIITIIVGIIIFLVGFVFHRFNWPDLWNGLMSGPIITLIGVAAYFIQAKKTAEKSAPQKTVRKSKGQAPVFRTFFAFIASISLVALIFSAFVLHQFKTSEPYLIAKETAFQHPEIQALTGKISGTGFIIGGNINEDSASLNFSIIGEKQDVRIDCKLHKSEPDT